MRLSRVIGSSQGLDDSLTELGDVITELVPSDRLSITFLAEPGEPPTYLYQYGVLPWSEARGPT